MDRGAAVDYLSGSPRVRVRDASVYLGNSCPRFLAHLACACEMWLACWTCAEIAEAVGLSEKEIGKVVSDQTAELPKGQKVLAHHESDFDVPIYNVWKQQTKSEGSSSGGEWSH